MVAGPLWRAGGRVLRQTRFMKLAEVAIVVSSVSATITGANAYLSYRTFRMVRPRVKVRVGHVMDLHRRRQYILRFLNTGATPVSVEMIELASHESRFRYSSPSLVKAMMFERGTSQEPIEVPGLNGTTFRFFTAHGPHLDGKNLRFRVVLSNGRTIVSRVVKYKGTPEGG